MDEDINPVICGVIQGDRRAWVPIEDYERVRRKKAIMTECLVTIWHAMNKLDDDLAKEDSLLTDETQPSSLGD